MDYSSFPANSNVALVADTSVLINLTATGFSDRIIGALKNTFVITGNVYRELKEGVKRGYEEGKEIQNLIDSGTVAVTDLGGTGKSIYASLVAGDTVQTLDDGEASVIACAVEIKGVAVIDERKAKRVCRERFPQTSTMMTIDLLLDEAVGKALGKERQRDAVYKALSKANMRIPRKIERDIVILVGKDRAADCSSLSEGSRLA